MAAFGRATLLLLLLVGPLLSRPLEGKRRRGGWPVALMSVVVVGFHHRAGVLLLALWRTLWFCRSDHYWCCNSFGWWRFLILFITRLLSTKGGFDILPTGIHGLFSSVGVTTLLCDPAAAAAYQSAKESAALEHYQSDFPETQRQTGYDAERGSGVRRIGTNGIEKCFRKITIEACVWGRGRLFLVESPSHLWFRHQYNVLHTNKKNVWTYLAGKKQSRRRGSGRPSKMFWGFRSCVWVLFGYCCDHLWLTQNCGAAVSFID
jgi:hypothetical protein